MKELVSLIDINKDSDIEAIVDQLMEEQARFLASRAKKDRVAKHLKESQSPHEELDHGARDGTEKGSPEDSTSTEPAVEGQESSEDQRSSEGPLVETPREDAAFVRSINDKYLTQAGTQIAHIAENAGIDQMSIAGERRGIDTMGMYGVWSDDEFQGYTGERTEWQAQMLAEMQTEQARANGMEPKQDGKAVIMLGNPGAGKTFLVQNELNEYVDTREFLTINADDVKSKIIYQDTPPEIEGIGGDELASMVHEESSYMRKRWEQTAMASNTNIILDVTGANREKTIKVLEQLKSKGYEITLAHADVTIEEAQASALRRAATTGSGGFLGRIVPAEFIESLRSKTTKGSDVIDENFDNYLPYASSAYWFRTYPLNIERPKDEHRPVELLWSSQ